MDVRLAKFRHVVLPLLVAAFTTAPVNALAPDPTNTQLIAAGGSPAYDAFAANRGVRAGQPLSASEVSAAKAASGSDFVATSTYCQTALSNYPQRAPSDTDSLAGASDRIRTQVLAAVQAYGKAVTANDPAKMNAAVTSMFAACHFFAIAYSGSGRQNAALSGIPTPTPVVKISLSSSNPVELEAVAPGEMISSDIVLTNSGTAPLSVTGFGFQGAGAAAFTAVRSACPDTVAPSGTCVIEVTFLPPGNEGAEATLRIDSNADGSPTYVTLKGNVCYPNCWVRG
jgi:hypothetical protein